MNIEVRLGTRDDIPALVEVECSDVETWYHYSPKGRGDPASYDELSSYERCMHGGSWMDISELTKYWDDIERLGIIPLVAEIDGKVVGHLDVIFSKELPLGHFLYLDVLMVHRAYRRRGVASSLIMEAERLARSNKVKFMLVSTQEYEGPSGSTYRSCGFERAFEVFNLEMRVNHQGIPTGIKLMSISHKQKAPVMTHEMICGWYNISRKMWDFGINPNLTYGYRHQLALTALIEKRVIFFHIQQNLFDQSKGSLRLWTPMSADQKELQSIINTSKAVASWLGVKVLTTKTLDRYVSLLEKGGFSTKSKAEPFLTKSIDQ